MDVFTTNSIREAITLRPLNTADSILGPAVKPQDDGIIDNRPYCLSHGGEERSS